MSPYVSWLVRCSVCLSGIISSFTSHASIGALVNINSIKKLIFNALSLPHSPLSPTTVTSHLQHGPALPFPLDTLQTGSNQNGRKLANLRNTQVSGLRPFCFLLPCIIPYPSFVCLSVCAVPSSDPCKTRTHTFLQNAEKDGFCFTFLKASI